MLKFLCTLEQLYDRKATEEEKRRWEELLSGCDEDLVNHACAIWIESFETTDVWPTAEDILRYVR